MWNVSMVTESTVLYNISNGTINSTEEFLDCDEWDESRHALYQLANLCLAVAFLVPNSLHYHSLLLRSLLCLGSFCLLLWAGIVSCYADILGWCLAIFFINLVYLVLVLYYQFPVRFDVRLEKMYCKMFKPLKMTRSHFRELAHCGQINQVAEGDVYAEEGTTVAGEKLSILLSGRLQVSCDECFLHYIEPNHFIDSPEYDARITSRTEEGCFQVTIRAVEESEVFTWPSRVLQNYLEIDNSGSTILHNLVGKDITGKLYQIQELLMSNPQLRRVSISKNSTGRTQFRLQRHLPDHFAAADVLCPGRSRDISGRSASLVPDGPDTSPMRPASTQTETRSITLMVQPETML